MKNLLLIFFASLSFCFPTSYIAGQNISVCNPGFRTSPLERICIPCKRNTYNQGAMPIERTKCYSITQPAITYINSTSITCSDGWEGIPIYKDGEYQSGCIISDTIHLPPISLCGICPYTKKPTPYPTKKPTPYPTKYPTRFPTKYPTRFPTKYPTKKPTSVQTSRPSPNPTRIPTSKPTKKPSKKKKKPTPYPTVYPTKDPTKQPTKQPIPPPPPPDPHHTIIIYHHGDDDNGDSTNKYDMAIAGIVVSAIVLIIGAFLCYKKKMKKNKFRMEQDRISRNIRLSSNIELPDYRPNKFVEPVIMGTSIQPQATQLPVGRKIDVRK